MTRLPSTEPPPGAGLPTRHPDAPAPGSGVGSHYAHCFGCGERHPTGLQMRVVAEEGLAMTGVFVVTGDHQGAPGLAHGGLLAAAFDEALGSLIWLLQRPAVTARLETDYLLPVPVGSTLHISARVTGVDGRKVYTAAEGCLGDAGGPVAVRASALFVQVGMEHFVTHARPAELDAIRRDPALHRGVRDFEVNP